jgi:hypothetical protein
LNERKYRDMLNQEQEQPCRCSGEENYRHELGKAIHIASMARKAVRMAGVVRSIVRLWERRKRNDVQNQ